MLGSMGGGRLAGGLAQGLFRNPLADPYLLGSAAGASLAVPLADQGSVAGVITSANGISFVAAPAIGMALYAVDPRLPFAASALLLVGLALAGRDRIDR